MGLMILSGGLSLSSGPLWSKLLYKLFVKVYGHF